MEKMGEVEPNLEVFFEEKKRVRNPFVPVGKFLFRFLLSFARIQFSLIYLVVV